MRLLAICAIALSFAFVGSMPLAGPIALMVVSHAARGRFGGALRIGFGAAVAEGIYAGVAYWGFATFLARHKTVVPISHGVSALVLAALGARFVVWKLEDEKKAEGGAEPGTALVGFTLAALNPTLVLTWSAAVAFVYSKGLGQTPPAYAIPFGVCVAIGVAAWFSLLVKLVRKYHGKLPRKALTWMVRILGAALVGLGVWSGVQLLGTWKR